MRSQVLYRAAQMLPTAIPSACISYLQKAHAPVFMLFMLDVVNAASWASPFAGMCVQAQACHCVDFRAASTFVLYTNETESYKNFCMYGQKQSMMQS